VKIYFSFFSFSRSLSRLQDKKTVGNQPLKIYLNDRIHILYMSIYCTWNYRL